MAEERRGPATALTARLFATLQTRNWDSLSEQIAKSPDDVFPKVFPLVGELADEEDAVSRAILSAAAADLAELARSVADQLGWHGRDFPIAKMGGAQGRSLFFDNAIEMELKWRLPRSQAVPVKIAPAEGAVGMALRLADAKGNAA
jgi:N-acetylglucosamine kinase-like BadF-type ATPase